MCAFEVGELVELKTGGIHKIVKEIVDYQTVVLQWFDSYAQEEHIETYDVRMLRKVANQEEEKEEKDDDVNLEF